MAQGVSSGSIRSASELLFRAPVILGFVLLDRTMSRASRLLTTLHKRRRLAAERDVSDTAEAEQLDRLAKLGRRIIARLERVEQEESEDIARLAWKRVLQDPRKSEEAAALWAAIRESGGVMHTPFGVLVGSKEGAEQVLGSKGKTFSVREYWHRIVDLTGEHYIAFDPEPGELRSNDPDVQAKHTAYEARMRREAYEASATVPNDYISREFSGAGALEALQRAHDVAKDVLDQGLSLGDGGRGRINAEDIGIRVVASFSNAWFGVPPDNLSTIALASRDTFYPSTEVVTKAPPVGTLEDSPFARHLTGEGIAEDEVRKAMVGSAIGFAPAIACISRVLGRWMKSDELAHQAESWCGGNRDEREQRLRRAVVRTLIGNPVPPLLYRTAMKGAKIDGQPVEPGTLAIVGLGSVALDDPEKSFDWLFGGDRDTNPHGCPGRHAAIGVVVGAISAVLERHDVRHGGGGSLVFGATRSDAAG